MDARVYSKPDGEYTEFTIKATMRSRWVPHFLAMLKYMQQLGSIGSSREVCIYADGDGNFSPKFEWCSTLKSNAKPVKDTDGNRVYDTG